MELPQPRPLGTQGRKPTHDFLSLYSPPPVPQQDPPLSGSATTPSNGYLETHDFLQPLERVGKNVAKEQLTAKSASLPPPTTVEHILPGGIGTYSISHISYINQSQRISRPDGVVITASQPQCSDGSDKNDENSNCTSYTGSGFSLWNESAVRKGKTGKENVTGNRHVIIEGGMKIGGVPWMASLERPSQSSSAHNHPSTTISSLSSSRPSSAPKNPSFVDMLKSAKITQEDEDDEEEFVIKKEPSLHYKGVLSVKVDTTHHDQKPNTPRSKHSATEQRRRSKINDRFSMLRELIPHSDQKRDKASFLLEVIEYIQFLQEKVHKYEDSCRGWNNDSPAIIPRNNNQRPTEGFIDQPQLQNDASGAALAYGPKRNENKCTAPSNLPKRGPKILDSDLSSHEPMKEIGQHNMLTNRASPCLSPLQPNIYSPGCTSTSQTSQLQHTRSCTTDCIVSGDKLKDQELTIESGTISVSAIYSQGLLSTLTQALQSSGVDLSQANISVQIDLGKRANTTTLDSIPIHKKPEVPPIEEPIGRSRLASSREETSDKPLKRFKTSRN